VKVSFSASTDSGDNAEIVKLHNDYRASVSPAAIDMQKMYWDDELARTAQALADKCIYEHEDAEEALGWGISVGQNLAAGSGPRTWQNVVSSWHSEVKDFTYGSSSNSLMAVGHYTAVVHAKSSRVGCGSSYCPNAGWAYQYVCDYAYSQSGVSKPYAIGYSSKCSNNLNGNLCDCGGRVCKNGGTLDVSTCQCQCPKVYQGSSCETKNCNGVLDDNWCGSINTAGCTVYDNYPKDCPKQCGVC